ncbi:MAG: hypothetical protein IJJ65_02220 [Butyrivibrio sp.]|nr:hypothetical protein [Butyrivibrio sp.]
MCELSYDCDIISKLEEVLGAKTVILFDCGKRDYLDLLIREVNSRNLANVEVWHDFDGISESDKIKKKSYEQICEILKLYRLYDFSDRLFVISEDSQYGNLFNYVKNGVLSSEELVEAWLTNL